MSTLFEQTRANGVTQERVLRLLRNHQDYIREAYSARSAIIGSMELARRAGP